jgi:hypothetical protein
MTQLFTACVVLKWRSGVQHPAAALLWAYSRPLTSYLCSYLEDYGYPRNISLSR